MAKYDYLIVGAGLYGAMFAYKAIALGKKVLVLDRRQHRGGNIYCKNIDGIAVHYYGAHIFHTSNKEVWDFVNSIVEFVPYVNSPIANYKGELYNMPFNMNTFYQLWGCVSPQEARAKIDQQRQAAGIVTPENLEEQAIALVGSDIYDKLIKGYTEKQWGYNCKDLPAFIIKRIPVRYTFDNNYFSDTYQGIPQGGYNAFIDKLFDGADMLLGTDFMEDTEKWSNVAHNILYTGRIDEFFGYKLGKLEYRGLHFEHIPLELDNFQGVAVMNFTDKETPYTRIIEHKHFDKTTVSKSTIITKEYPVTSVVDNEVYYPVNNDINNDLYQEYAALARKLPNVRFGGRLGEYKYYDMDKIVEAVLSLFEA